MFQNVKKREGRRGFPIHGYVGANGGGKSCAMVWDTLPSLEAGRPVLSTVRLLDYQNPRDCDGCDSNGHDRPVYGPLQLMTDETAVADMLDAGCDVVADALGSPIGFREVVSWGVHKQAHPLWIPFTDWQQLLDAHGCDVLMDEVTGVASSRESMGLPAAVANTLVQMRRADVQIRWSAPAWARADKIIRETSQSVTYCVGRMPKRPVGSVKVEEGDPEDDNPQSSKGKKTRVPVESRMWRQRRLFTWKTYSAMDFEDFTAGKREQLRPEVRDLHWGPSSPAFLAYDTYDSVATIGTVSDAGTCYRCGGTRRRPQCSCDSDSGPARRPRTARGTRAPAKRSEQGAGRTTSADADVPATQLEHGPGVPALG